MPTAQEVSRSVDSSLSGLGFQRRGKTWTRRAGDLHDVVNLQVSKGGDSVTLNVGIFDRACDQLCWGPGERSISEVSCAFVERIGYLVGRTDLWWSLEEEHTPTEVAEAAMRHAIPLFERLSTREAVADALQRQPKFNWSYPFPKICFAAMRALTGHRDEALLLLQKVQAAGGGWAARAVEVEGRICGF